MSKAEAFVQDDWMRDGVKIAVRLSQAAQVLGGAEAAENAGGVA